MEIQMHRACGTMPNSVYSMETSEVPAPYINHPAQGNPMHCVLPNGMETQSSIDMLDLAFHHNLSTHHPFIAGFDSASSQVSKNTFFDTISSIVDSSSRVLTREDYQTFS